MTREEHFDVAAKVATLAARYQGTPGGPMAALLSIWIRAIDDIGPDSHDVAIACLEVAGLYRTVRPDQQGATAYVPESAQSVAEAFMVGASLMALKMRDQVDGRYASIITGYTQRHLRRLARTGRVKAEIAPDGSWRYLTSSVLDHKEAGRGPYRKGRVGAQ